MKKLINKTQFAISTEETRYYLNGIYLHVAGSGKNATLRAVATDGHRLARYELELPDGAKDMPGVIVPRKTVAELRRLLDRRETVRLDLPRRDAEQARELACVRRQHRRAAPLEGLEAPERVRVEHDRPGAGLA